MALETLSNIIALGLKAEGLGSPASMSFSCIRNLPSAVNSKMVGTVLLSLVVRSICMGELVEAGTRYLSCIAGAVLEVDGKTMNNLPSGAKINLSVLFAETFVCHSPLNRWTAELAFLAQPCETNCAVEV